MLVKLNVAGDRPPLREGLIEQSSRKITRTKYVESRGTRYLGAAKTSGDERRRSRVVKLDVRLAGGRYTSPPGRRISKRTVPWKPM